MTPWTPEDATRHQKLASTPKLQRMWSDVANSALDRGASEASAIQQANAVVHRSSRKKLSPAQARYLIRKRSS